MIEAIAIPILLKTVDFLFGEGSKILQERRERRKTNKKSKKISDENITSTHPSKPTAVDSIQSRETALSEKITKTVWSQSEAEIKHLMSLLEIQTRNYYLAKEQYAKWGGSLVPPIVVNNLIEAEDAIAAAMKELQTALSKVYDKRIAPPELEEV